MSDEIIATTRKWLERAVIGLNFCPFARGVHVRGQIRYVVSAAQTEDALLDDLEHELKFLADASVIYQRNIETMKSMGLEGWQALNVGTPVKPKP